MEKARPTNAAPAPGRTQQGVGDRVVAVGDDAGALDQTNSSAFWDRTTRNPAGHGRCGVLPDPGVPTPFSTIANTGARTPKAGRPRDTARGCSGTSTVPPTVVVGNAASRRRGSSGTRRTPAPSRPSRRCLRRPRRTDRRSGAWTGGRPASFSAVLLPPRRGHDLLPRELFGPRTPPSHRSRGPDAEPPARSTTRQALEGPRDVDTAGAERVGQRHGQQPGS